MPPTSVATGFATSLLLVALPALMPAPQAVAAQGPLDTGAWPERLSALEPELDELLDAGAISGLSIAVVADDRVWTREAGVLRRGASEAISHETLFEAASLGKPAFAYLDPSSGVGFVYFANSTNGLSILSRVLNRLFPARHHAARLVGVRASRLVPGLWRALEPHVA